MYPAAALDWGSRRVLSWRISLTLDRAFCIAAVEEALTRHGRPDSFNTDQGAQFTSAGFAHLRQAHGIPISMDGTGGSRDNVFVAGLWRSLVSEEVYLHACDSQAAATGGIARH